MGTEHRQMTHNVVATPLVLLPVFLEGFSLLKDVVQCYQDPKCSTNVLKYCLQAEGKRLAPKSCTLHRVYQSVF